MTLLDALSENATTARNCDPISGDEHEICNRESVHPYICCDDGIIVRTPTASKTHEFGSNPDGEQNCCENQRDKRSCVGYRILLVHRNVALPIV